MSPAPDRSNPQKDIMKKLVIAAISTAFIGFAAAPTPAQAAPDPDPVASIPADQAVECGESDDRVDENGDGVTDNCIDYYLEINPGGFLPICQLDAPFISYNITVDTELPTPTSATITLFDTSGNEVEVYEVDSLQGTLIYPGAAVDADGNGIDWPGWVQTNTGAWVRDPSDEFLRDGVNVLVEINPTSETFVDYPPATSDCADPPANLVRTGSDTALPLQIGGVLLLGGLIALVATHRRRSTVIA